MSMEHDNPDQLARRLFIYLAVGFVVFSGVVIVMIL